MDKTIVSGENFPAASFEYEGQRYIVDLVELLRAVRLNLELPDGLLIELNQIDFYIDDSRYLTVTKTKSEDVLLSDIPNCQTTSLSTLNFDGLLESERIKESLENELLDKELDDWWEMVKQNRTVYELSDIQLEGKL